MRYIASLLLFLLPMMQPLLMSSAVASSDELPEAERLRLMRDWSITSGQTGLEAQSAPAEKIVFSLPAIASSPETAEVAQKIFRTIKTDLEGSGRFASLMTGDNLPADRNGMPWVKSLDSWRSAGVRVLILGKVSTRGSKILPEFSIWEIRPIGARKRNLTVMPELFYPGFVGHFVSNWVYRSLTGEYREFNSFP
jgi:hypothetical protein